MDFAHAEKLSFEYPGDNEFPALNQVNFKLGLGQHIAIVGGNGSGKSSLAKLLAALFKPTSGRLIVLGHDIALTDQLSQLRPKLAIVFQNPDNQIVSTSVEEDVAFGPENLGIKNPKLRQIVDQALAKVGLLKEAKVEPTELSGGQKQKLALAGVLAMGPEVLILDEASSMLDPGTAKDLFEFIFRLAEEENLTLINITHDMSEAMAADQVLVLREGSLVFQGKPSQLFSGLDLSEYNLALPQQLALKRSLAMDYGISLGTESTTVDELAAEICSKIEKNLPTSAQVTAIQEKLKIQQKEFRQAVQAEEIIEVNDICFNYRPNLPISREALRGVSFRLRRGEILAVVGPSGAGKSTLMLHLNGLLRLQQGKLKILGLDLDGKPRLKQLRQKVGLVFQYPENQLFAEDVARDIGFGPKQMGLDQAEVEVRVKRAMDQVGLGKDFLTRSPFELSGGEMRRVALAGILAMETEILVLDEPSAGLDPKGSMQMVELLKKLQAAGRSLILVTHNMEDAAELADRVLVMKDGQDLAFGPAEEIFNRPDILAQAKLEATPAQELVQLVNQYFSWNFKVQTFADASLVLSQLLRLDLIGEGA